MLNIPRAVVMKPDQYKIINETGRGKITIAYLSSHIATKKPVILKVLHPELALEQEIKFQFLQRAMDWADLEHRRLMPVYDVCDLPNTCYYVTEYFPSRLENRIRGGLKVDELKSIIKSIAEAIQYMHDQGVVHGGIKTSNILFRKNGVAVLSDFSVPGLQNRTEADLQEKQIDMQGMGLTLYEMITGRHISTIDSLNLDADLKLPGKLEAFKPVLSKLLDRRPGHGFENMWAFLREFPHVHQAKSGKAPQAQIFKEKQPPAPITPEPEPEWPTELEVPEEGGSAIKKALITSTAVLVCVLAAFQFLPMFLHRDTQAALPIVEESAAGKQKPDPSQPKVLAKASSDSQQPDPARSATGHTPNSLADEEQIKIDKQHWLDRAILHSDSQRLWTPPEDNAALSYRKVLGLDPDNAEAKAGLEKIIRTLTTKVREMYRKGDYTAAESLAQTGLILSPGQKVLEELHHEIGIVIATNAYERAVRIKKQKIGGLLDKARKQWLDRKIVDPEGDNAFESYREVLRLDATNRQAKQAMEKMARYCAELAQHWQAKGDLEKSLEYINKAIEIRPDKHLLMIRRQLNEKKSNQQPS